MGNKSKHKAGRRNCNILRKMFPSENTPSRKFCKKTDYIFYANKGLTPEILLGFHLSSLEKSIRSYVERPTLRLQLKAQRGREKGEIENFLNSKEIAEDKLKEYRIKYEELKQNYETASTF